MTSQQVKKMKQGMSYSCKEKTIILNVFKYFRLEFTDICVTEIVRRTAKATGCSEKSIFQFRKEEASIEGFKEPSRTKIRKNININSRDVKYDNTVRQAIRSIVYDLKYRSIIPSLNTILKQVNVDVQLPNFSLMTLRRLLFDMGFSYEKSGNKSILVEKSVNVNKDNIQLPKVKENKTKKPLQQNQNTPNSSSIHDTNIHNYGHHINKNAHKPTNIVPNTNCLSLPNMHNNHQYNSQNHLPSPVPMHLSQFDTHGHSRAHMMGPMHPSHNMSISMLNTRGPPPAPMVQNQWIHTQIQPPLVISTN